MQVKMRKQCTLPLYENPPGIYCDNFPESDAWLLILVRSSKSYIIFLVVRVRLRTEAL